MLFGTPAQLKAYDGLQVFHRNQQLTPCTTFKYLGIMLDPNLNFSAHIEYMKSKTLGKIRLLGRVCNIIDRSTAELLYKTLILPIYDYCDYVYYPINVNSIDILQKLQNVALRVITRSEPRASTNSLHIDAQMPHLTHHCKLHVAEQRYKFVNGNCPDQCTTMFQSLNEQQTRSTRSENEDLLVVLKRRLVLTERHPLLWCSCLERNSEYD